MVRTAFRNGIEILVIAMMLSGAYGVASAQIPASGAVVSGQTGTADGQMDQVNNGDFGRGNVYTMSNAEEGNEILVYRRQPNGLLSYYTSFPTGGMGTGAGLGNQSGLMMSDDGHWMFAVNAGSDELSVFRVTPNFLVLTDIKPSGGTTPISVAVHDDLVYVLHAADAGSINGFTLSDQGKLSPIAGSERPLSGANPAGPAQIAFSPDGGVLVVTEKPGNLITTLHGRWQRHGEHADGAGLRW